MLQPEWTEDKEKYLILKKVKFDQKYESKWKG